jgi:hypothetical protein
VSFSGTEARTGRVEIQQLRQEHEQKKEVHELMLKHLEEEHVQKLEFNPRIAFIKIKIPPGGARNKTEAIAGEINYYILTLAKLLK